MPWSYMLGYKSALSSWGFHRSDSHFSLAWLALKLFLRPLHSVHMFCYKKNASWCHRCAWVACDSNRTTEVLDWYPSFSWEDWWLLLGSSPELHKSCCKMNAFSFHQSTWVWHGRHRRDYLFAQPSAREKMSQQLVVELSAEPGQPVLGWQDIGRPLSQGPKAQHALVGGRYSCCMDGSALNDKDMGARCSYRKVALQERKVANGRR